MKRYAFAGASGRCDGMYAHPMFERYKDTCELVGIYDINIIRSNYISKRCGDIPVFTDFDEMIRVGRPDVVIVTTKDCFHHEYIIRALEAGCDAITEKPMTTDETKIRAIRAAEKRTGKKVIVTFNYRYAPYISRVKELLREGLVGDILHVDFEWVLDTRHGADYFRRWHRMVENGGSLLVHKATHHFDMVNWWIEDDPQQVHAYGSLRFYGAAGKIRGERCLGCKHAEDCEYWWDITASEHSRQFYYEAESEDGYHRDGCVFDPEINIWDTMGLNVKYKNGPIMSYSLIAHSPYEGWRATISGTKGRLEAWEYHSRNYQAEADYQTIHYYNRKNELIEYHVPKARSGHGGGDGLLQDHLFVEKDHKDPLGLRAGSWAGSMSVLIGVAARESIYQEKPINIADLIQE